MVHTGLRSCTLNTMARSTRRIATETELYAPVADWCRRHFGCFATAIARGLAHSAIDVIALRDIGGDLSGDVEVIAIEVKRGNQPFATTSGQTAGYRVYANRVYLADLRHSDFTADERDIALHLGIGLIQISGGNHRRRLTERLASPSGEAIQRMQAQLLERLAFGRCCICGSIFATGRQGNRFENLTRVSRRPNHVERAVDTERGLVYWHSEISMRRKPFRDRRSPEYIYNRRFVCKECVRVLLSHTVAEDNDA